LKTKYGLKYWLINLNYYIKIVAPGWLKKMIPKRLRNIASLK